jgi:hypothetical protein
MAEDRFEAELRSWLAQEAPAEAPDRILDAVSARIIGSAARHDWPALPGWAVAAVAMFLAVLLLGLARVLNVGSPSQPPPSTPPRAASVDCPTSPCSYPLRQPGTYQTVEFAVPMTFTVTDDRWVVSYDNAAFVRIERAIDPRQRLTILANLDPMSSAGYPPPVATDRESLVAWVSGHPDLVVADRGAVSVGGLPGTRLDITGSIEARTRGLGCDALGLETIGCVTLFATTGVPFGVSWWDSVRLYLLDVAGTTVAVAVEARHLTPNTEGFMPLADALLASLKFGT